MDWYIWLGVVIFLVLIEIVTVNLTTIWFVVSGIAALIFAFLTDNFLVQFGVFVILGVILLLLTRDTLVKWLTPKKEAKTNLERILKNSGIVTEKITKDESGEVKVDGKRWTAVSENTINVGERVLIDRIDGVKLVVKKEEN